MLATTVNIVEISVANPTYHTEDLKKLNNSNNVIHLKICDTILAIEFKYNLFDVNVAIVNTLVIKLKIKLANTIIMETKEKL